MDKTITYIYSTSHTSSILTGQSFVNIKDKLCEYYTNEFNALYKIIAQANPRISFARSITFF